MEKLQATLKQIGKIFPRSKLLCSNLLPRFNRRYMYSEDIKAIKDSRKRVNRASMLLVTVMGGSFIKHPQLDGKDPTLFHGDGVHLSKRGTIYW